MKKPIVNLNNKEVGNLEIDEKIFGLKTYPDIIHHYIRYQNAKNRQGSHKTKSRSEVSGKSKKPFSQKGTGNARQGSSKPPNFRGGAVAMGPQNRDYTFKLNKKEKMLAIRSALSTKLLDNQLLFIDTFKLDNHKTKELDKSLKNFEYTSALFIYSENGIDKNFKLASSNIPRVSVLNQKGLNVRDLINNDKVFIEKNTVEELSKRLA